MSNAKQEFIRKIAVLNHINQEGSLIQWSRHAITALIEDSLTRGQVEAALEQCVVIEDYPHENRPLPDCLILAFLVDGIPIHAVIALNMANERLFIVTVYIPSKERWKDDWKTRK